VSASISRIVPFVLVLSLVRPSLDNLAHRKGILDLTGLFVVVAAARDGNVSSRLSRGGFGAPSEQSVGAAAGRARTRRPAAQPLMANVQSSWSLGGLVAGRIVRDDDQITQREPDIAAVVEVVDV
jgi:hypothetical protein